MTYEHPQSDMIQALQYGVYSANRARSVYAKGSMLRSPRARLLAGGYREPPHRAEPSSRPAVVDLKDVAERAYAALLGSAIGDAFGATTEFMMPGEIQQCHGVLRDIIGGGWLRLPPGEVTDDTQMALCVARSIAEKGWSPNDIADRFVTWLKSKPIDVGNTCRRGIRRYMVHGTIAGPAFEDDAGNGAVMRVVPVALATLADSRLLRERVIEQAHITHNHFLSDSACCLTGSLVQLACVGTTKLRMLQLVNRVIQDVTAFGFRPYRRLCTAYVVDTMQTVLHYFFSTRTFEDCLVGVVNQGGDADTAGAIAGAIAGAYYGLASIPERWKRKLPTNLAAEIQSLSGQLVAQSPLLRGVAVASFDSYTHLPR